MCHTMGFSVGRPLFIAISWQLNDKPTNDTLEEDVGRVGGGYATQKSIPETGKCYGNTLRITSVISVRFPPIPAPSPATRPLWCWTKRTSLIG